MSPLRRLLSVLALLALAVLLAVVWFFGPFLHFGDVTPLADVTTRVAAILILVIAAAVLAVAVARWKDADDLIFAPEPEALPLPPDRDGFTGDEPGYEAAAAQHKQLCDDRKTYHREISTTIQRIFYLLLGTCVFCVITLLGSADKLLLTPTATVKLPILNYDIGFQAFLVFGPLIIIGLAVYLHAFVEQHRRYVIPEASRKPILANLDGLASRAAVIVLFYWLVPLTLALFAWKASPQPVGPWLVALTLATALAMAALHFRRTTRQPRGVRRKLAVLSLAVLGFSVVVVEFTWTARDLNLFRVNLAGEDLRDVNLQGANLAQADLRKASLDNATLSRANFNKADLRLARLSGANLSLADLLRC